ncbi:putative ribonuclease H-like domain-containing protein [Tanacetum coccineum]
MLGINLHKRIDQGLGSTSGIKACALRNFSPEVIEFETAQNNTTAKFPILKLGEYEMWEMRIKQYFQVQDYALWEVIENGNSWVSVPQITQDNGTSVTKMSVPVTAEEKINKKNDVKARSLLLMALPNEHQLTFSQYTDAKTMYAAIKTRFGGNETTKKTQNALLKQQYENFNASSTESLDFIFNRLQKLVSRLAILSVVITTEDLNSKFLRSLPPEWNTHVVVWMNKAEIETMSIDYLYNNFKIVEQEVKKSVGASTVTQNMAFITTPSTSNTNDNTANSACKVSTVSPNINTASSSISTANISDNAVYAFMVENPNGSNLLHQDLEQIHEDDLEAMDLKWQLSLLSMRAKRYYQRTGKKIFINANDTAGFDKSKVECFNCHKMGHFAREYRAPRNKDGQFRNQDNRNWNQDSSKRTVNIEDTSSKAMLAIDGVGFDWSDMTEEQIQTNMALMAFSDSEVYNDKSCSKTCQKNYETLKKQCDDLIVKLNDIEFKAATYKRGLATVEDQLVTFRKNEVLFGEEIAALKREVGCKDYELGVLKAKYEKVKQEKEGIDFKIAKFDNASKDLDKLLASQITDKSKKGLGLDEFKEPEFNGFTHNVNTAKAQAVNTARPKTVKTARPNFVVVNAGKMGSMLLSPQHVGFGDLPDLMVHHLFSTDITTLMHEADPSQFVDSGCSRHMTGNIAYLSNFKEFDRGNVTFGEEHMVEEFLVKMCDKKNYVLFTDSECLVLSPNFKLPDENQILLRIPREDNMYSFDIRNIVPKETLTCLVAKATSDESMIWHKRLGHINFKNINKLVKENLVRGLPLKYFENDQTCVACLKGKQHRASCKSKVLNPITKPLFMLHIDLFGPTFVSSLMHKKYWLVITDDYSKFTWVFFLATKDETSEILKNFIKEIENLVDKKVKIIRCDNGTEFKYKVMDDFYREKCIRREYSIARTP